MPTIPITKTMKILPELKRKVQLNKVYDITLLTQNKLYQIDGILYHFIYKTDSINHPQFIFRPLGRQCKTADVKLNRSKLLIRVFEVEGLNAPSSLLDGGHLQMSLF